MTKVFKVSAEKSDAVNSEKDLPSKNSRNLGTKPKRQGLRSPIKINNNGSDKERIAKVIANHNMASRRGAEEMIALGLVSVDGEVISTPALKVSPGQKICVNGFYLPRNKPAAKLFAFHKRSGLVTTKKDEQGRRTIYSEIPSSLCHLLTIGRLDIKSEGLLLMTNNGALKRYMELPSSEIKRTYMVQVSSRYLFPPGLKPESFMDLNYRSSMPCDKDVKKLKEGIRIESFQYKPISCKLLGNHTLKEENNKFWLELTLTEGKNQEIRKVLGYLGFYVNRLIRQSYGAFALGNIKPGKIEEIDITMFPVDFDNDNYRAKGSNFATISNSSKGRK